MTMPNGQHPDPRLPPVPPAALPMAWEMQVAEVRVQTPAGQQSQRQVVIATHRPSGTDYFFLPPDAARRFAEQLTQHAGEAESGIQVIRSAQIPPGLRP